MRLCGQHQGLKIDAGVEYRELVQATMHKHKNDRGRSEEFEIAPHLNIARGVVLAFDSQKLVQTKPGGLARRLKIVRVLERGGEVAVGQPAPGEQELEHRRPAATLGTHADVETLGQLRRQFGPQRAAGDRNAVGMRIAPARRMARAGQYRVQKFGRYGVWAEVTDAAACADQFVDQSLGEGR